MQPELDRAAICTAGRGGTRAPDPAGVARYARRVWATGWWLALCWCLSFDGMSASLTVSKEFQLKAVFLWRLGQFTEWPSDAFENEESPVVIGVLGDNPFGDALSLAVKGETAHGRKLVIQNYHQVAEIKTCHVLYINEPDYTQIPRILAALGQRSILTVSDSEGFARYNGGMVRFITEQNKIKLRINLAALTAARLVLDARVLRAAELVGNR